MKTSSLPDQLKAAERSLAQFEALNFDSAGMHFREVTFWKAEVARLDAQRRASITANPFND